MANIVVCADGTWNTPDDKEDEIPAPTNVVKLYNSLDSQDENGIEQKKYYHPGVGTDGTWWQRLGGGGVGLGLGDNIKSAYKWLAVNYRPEDKIFLFGFSRGAYTVRSLGGMVSSCGLLDLSSSELSDDTIWNLVDDMFNCYRAGKRAPAAPKGMSFHNPDARKRGAHTTKIHFVGVWDTVGALGIPDDMGVLNLIDNPRHHSFHDTELSDTVLNARHAVAIDEQRHTFAPTLWSNIDQQRKRTVKQVWFPGVHSDVGGGYAVTGLSDGALDWMMGEAGALGLLFRAGARDQLHPDPRSLLHNSLTGVFAKLKSRPRNVPAFKKASTEFHRSAIDRHDNPPLYEATYWPSRSLRRNEAVGLDIFARQHWNATGLYLEGGKKYSFTALGQWLDSGIKSGPGGSGDGKFELKEAFHVASSGLGKLEGLFGKITGNQEADFLWTKRVENLPWFVLVGVIANGIGADPKGRLVDHETFKIGEGVEYAPKRSGYLFCFANDAWHAYDNNKGSVRLTVKRL